MYCVTLEATSMNDSEIEILNEIYDIVLDDCLSPEQALELIATNIEDRLARCGLYPQGHDPND
jgi:hypothetical protein